MASNEPYLMTKPTRIIWVHAVDPRPANAKLGTEPRFEVTFMFPEGDEDFKEIMRRMSAVAQEGLPGRALSTIKFPLKRGSAVADAAVLKGNADRDFLRPFSLLTAHTNCEAKTGPRKGQKLLPPRLVVLNNGHYQGYGDEVPGFPRAEARRFFYSGVLARGTFNFVAYEAQGGVVSVYLNELLSLNVGDRIQTGPDNEQKYGSAESHSEYIGKVSSVNPTAGLDDAISF